MIQENTSLVSLGYASLPGDARQGSGVGRPSTASQPPPSPSNKSRAPPQQQNSDDRGRPQQRQVSSAESTPAHRWFPNEYPDGAAYGAEVEPEIAHLEAVINSFGRNAASMPPSASPNPSPSPVVWTPRNGADLHQQHSIDGMKCGQRMATNRIPLLLTLLLFATPTVALLPHTLLIHIRDFLLPT